MNKFVVVISGKTCSGKTYTLEKMLENRNYTKLVTTTTRGQRDGEISGRDYHFIQSSLAEHYLENGHFVESNVHGGQLYGLTKYELKEKLASDKIPCVILTPNGLAPYKELLKPYGVNVLSFYIDCPDDVLFTRLAERTKKDLTCGSSDQLAVLKTSLLRVKDMVLKEGDWDSYKDQYDYVIDTKEDSPSHFINNKVMVYMTKNADYNSTNF